LIHVNSVNLQLIDEGLPSVITPEPSQADHRNSGLVIVATKKLLRIETRSRRLEQRVCCDHSKKLVGYLARQLWRVADLANLLRKFGQQADEIIERAASAPCESSKRVSEDALPKKRPLAGSTQVWGKRCPRHLDGLGTLVFGLLVLLVSDCRKVRKQIQR
jgi:hypothetical protein